MQRDIKDYIANWMEKTQKKSLEAKKSDIIGSAAPSSMALQPIIAMNRAESKLKKEAKKLCISTCGSMEDFEQ